MDVLNNKMLQLGNATAMRSLYVPLAYIIGDVEGGNQLTGYAGFSRMNCKRLCRTCHVSVENGPKMNVFCERIRVNHVIDLINRQDTAALRAMCQRGTPNAFYDIDCGDDPYVIFSMIHTEALHALEQGLFVYVIQVLMAQIGGDITHAFLDKLVKDLLKYPRQHGTQRFPHLNWKDGVSVSYTHLTLPTICSV